MGKCWMCAHYKGNCGKHRYNAKGHIDYESSIHGDDPKCFVESPEFVKEKMTREAEHICRCYPKETIQLALEMAEKNGQS